MCEFIEEALLHAYLRLKFIIPLLVGFVMHHLISLMKIKTLKLEGVKNNYNYIKRNHFNKDILKRKCLVLSTQLITTSFASRLLTTNRTRSFGSSPKRPKKCLKSDQHPFLLQRWKSSTSIGCRKISSQTPGWLIASASTLLTQNASRGRMLAR